MGLLGILTATSVDACCDGGLSILAEGMAQNVDSLALCRPFDALDVRVEDLPAYTPHLKGTVEGALAGRLVGAALPSVSPAAVRSRSTTPVAVAPGQAAPAEAVQYRSQLINSVLAADGVPSRGVADQRGVVFVVLGSGGRV
ncbi:hypothetical protein [Streptomyces sp. NPDC056663]|uniref:hypothetical protein n=1 Tax=Streptomyces sp. NPDC056663 TaxID=3345899 RepID=UPI003699CFE7